MRTIKFRGKARITGKWFYGNLYVEDSHGRTHIRTTECGCLDIDPDTVGQFTGLLDKNGKEIYEGDIVRYYDDIEDELVSSHVLYHKESCSFCAAPTKLCGDYIGICVHWQFEVIGNIHDNPSLISDKR